MKNRKLLKKKEAILTGIREGLIEIKDNRKSGKPLQTLSEFLADWNRQISRIH